MYAFSDNGEYIQLVVGTRTIQIKKDYIKHRVSGDYYIIAWHDKERRNNKYERKIDYNDVTSPSVSDATDLMDQIDEMIEGGGVPGSGNTTVLNETPTGAINGSNAVFTTSNNFTGNVVVKYNPGGVGGLQEMTPTTDYTITGANEITFTFAPPTSSIILISYIQA